MKNNLCVLLIIFSLVLWQRELMAQMKKAREITGTVEDERSLPLPGVTVRIKNVNLGTATDQEGRYRLKVPVNMEKFTLVFSFIGMASREIVYQGKDTIHVVLREEKHELEEVIVNTGYERINLRKSTSAIQSIKAKDIVFPGLSSIDQILEGYVPGLIYMQNSGQVGVSPRLSIRGTSTILGSREPVWVINGIVQESPVNIDPRMINDLDFVNLLGNAVSGLNPEDIKQIDILKDASATALYGARAANGVIVITTKKGKTGPPSFSYSFNGTFRKRPYYSDHEVNMMNSAERVDFSRELLEKRIVYPSFSSTWLGYEGVMYKYWQGECPFDEMQREVGFYESVNTDWFKELMKNSFSHGHTFNLSGGSSVMNYYTSLGYRKENGNIKGESNDQYTVSMQLAGKFGRFAFRGGVNGFVTRKEYVPEDVEVVRYAYSTTRALPLRKQDGSLWYYGKSVKDEPYLYRDYNILNEMENASRDIRASGFTATVNLEGEVTGWLTATLVGSYSFNNTTDEVWHGENSFYTGQQRGIIKYNEDKSTIPFGGELQYGNTEKYAYTLRGQLNARVYSDRDRLCPLTVTVGGEMSSNQYYGLKQVYRGYLKERGKKMIHASHAKFPSYAEWMYTDDEARGVWTDKLTNIVSGYVTCSYSYKTCIFNANARFDTSNRFGSRVNEKIAPIWSVSVCWDAKKQFLGNVGWVNDFALKGSYGYQGNMLESESAKLVLEKGSYNEDFKEYQAYVRHYPNPDLKWEKTSSSNMTVDFSFFQRRVAGSFSYFYKYSRNVFLNKNISLINGMGAWVVNGGNLQNQGTELSLDIVLINMPGNGSNGLQWRVSPRFGQVSNKVAGSKNEKTRTNEITYVNLLKGAVEVEGLPLNTFFSYKYLGLDSENGLPVFYGSGRMQYIGNKKTDLKELYSGMDLMDIFKDFMTCSGNRVPQWQGGFSNYISWRRFTMSLNLAYSFGNKIRLLKMFPDVKSANRTNAPQPLENVRKEFLGRWQKAGDEIHTNVPGIVTGNLYRNTLDMWWRNFTNDKGQVCTLGENLWTMYDHSDLRTVSGSYLKIQSFSIRYLFSPRWCDFLHVKSGHIAFSGTNIHTFCNRRLKGQDPATQDGVAPTINMSLRPAYSLSLDVSF